MWRNAVLAFGVDEEHIFVDHGLTGTNRARPRLREATAAVLSSNQVSRGARRAPLGFPNKLRGRDPKPADTFDHLFFGQARITEPKR